MKDKFEKISNAIKDIVFQSGVTESTKMEFSEEVIAACVQNYCGRYNKCWVCPPAVGTLEQLKDKCLKFEHALIFTTKHGLEDSFDIEGMFNARNEHEKVQVKVVDKLSFDKFFLLGVGGCSHCVECTYPDNPCRFPEKIVTPMEACGINVVNLSKTVGVNYHNGENTVTYFSAILF